MKNKYGTFVLKKAILFINNEDKFEIKAFLLKRITINSDKEKLKFSEIIALL